MMKFLYATLLSLITTVVYADIIQGDIKIGKEKSALCVACHTVDGNSTSPAWPKLAGQHPKYIYQQLKDYQSKRRVNAQMNAIVTGLTDDDMRHLAVYYASQTIKSGFANPQQIALGERIYRAGDHQAGTPACMACHNPAGEGNPLVPYPMLAGQHAEYLYTQLKAYKAETRNNDLNGVMRSITSTMNNAQMKAVSEYLQGLR